ncbi:MAG: dihydroorotate dehydrogenase [Anaerolineae bacterium]|nr:dihydroorotate dehydrogenase [Anaerolineae bacterium]
MSAPVELAPNHKFGLNLANPVMLAAGVAGYGDIQVPGLDLAALGGLVTAPVTRRPNRRQLPQIHELPGGLFWQRDIWNPGLRVVLRDFAPPWRRLGTPVIVHLGADDLSEVAALASALERTPGVAGLELDAPDDTDARHAVALVRSVRESSDLPILVRVPLQASDAFVKVLLEAPLSALVIAQPPSGARIDQDSGWLSFGSVHGPLLAPLVTARIAALADWVDVPLVACGGVHSLDDALAHLAAGAQAVQIDTAVWVDPGLPGRIIAALAGGPASQ